MRFFADILDTVRRRGPVVHCITNYVTVNDCANMILAAGGSPIMADDIAEVEDVVALAQALVINIGTLNSRTVEAMLVAGQRANSLGRPVVLDPVGAGATALRNSALQSLLREVRFAAIKGNISEIGFLAGEDARARGVDAEDASLVTEGSLKAASDMARRLSDSTGAVVVISGAIDIVAHAQGVWTVRNGHPLMARITGSGCMSAAVVGCCLGAAPDEGAQACLCAVSSMGVAGEIAAENMVGAGGGTGSYRALLIDAMSMLDGPTLTCRADVKNG
ncbi:hydroxyethylthiazole kinase [Desulfovibrio sp. 86]|uniref:Hydroxyethylthiazole kinase n=1 Tax=uncultured Desulfovibrio sp. TaxID=167968 RepID=A0A212L845_9BACT|nr:hydroxyethylthiazole kinase [Desulfovibrio sp. 86]SCM73647.1 Hydroxyethylthiazole kinase [uncultured Desulfovibrio sp.]VZH34333.1 Hydroxyethylthiazole kinase [Desulfovibrio sp. 86]